MASKAGQPEADKVDIEEALDYVDKTLDRTKVLYEQYFLGMQKQPPTQIHTDVERRLRDLQQLAIRNTGLRYRFATLQQKFGSYNSYWRRTLKQIENGTYIRNLQKISRKAALTGEAIPEEILAAMPKRMREQVKRDREQALAIAKRRNDARGDDGMNAPLDDGEDDAAAMIGESAEVVRQIPRGGAHTLDAGDGDLDFEAFFASVDKADDTQETAPAYVDPTPAPAPPARAAALPARPSKPVVQYEVSLDDDEATTFQPPPGPPPRATGPVAVQTRGTGSVPSGPPRGPQHPRGATEPGTGGPQHPRGATQPGAVPHPRAATPPPVPQRASGSMPALPGQPPQRASGAIPAQRPSSANMSHRTTESVPSLREEPVQRATGPLPVQRATGPLPVQRATGPLPVQRATGPLPVQRATGPVPVVPLPAGSKMKTGPVPVVPPPAGSMATGPVPVAPPQARSVPAISRPGIPRPGGAPAPSQISKPNPIAPGSSTARPAVPVETMSGPFPRAAAPPVNPRQEAPRVAPPKPQSPAPRPPPGMSDADVNALHATYVKAKQAVGEEAGPGSYGKLLQTINAQAPKIMEQYKAKGVEFSVVVKDNQVVIKAKPKT